jgi:probable HAF family extracellular repeat protein
VGTSVGHAFLYSNGSMLDLGTLGGRYSEAFAINASGQVVGDATTANASQGDHAFLYSNGSMLDLGTLGGAASLAYGINASGQVVGYATTANTSLTGHPFLYSNGSMLDLGTLGGEASYAFTGGGNGANGINASGQVVGEALTASLAEHAFLYSNGSMTDLNSLLPPDSGWTLQYASAINDAGQIVGYGLHNGQQRAFLLNVQSSAITPTSLAWNSTNLGVDFSYNVSATPSKDTSVALYWSSDTTFANRLSGPINRLAIDAGTEAGTTSVHVSASALGTPPVGAKDLLVVTDPDNVLGNFDPNANVKAIAYNPALTALSLAFDTTTQGADFTYSIGGSPLLQDTSVALYWSTDKTFAHAIGGAVFTQDVPQGSASGKIGPVHVDLNTPPDNAKYLLLVTDPDNILGNFSQSTNVVAAALSGVTVQSLVISTSPSGGADLTYQVAGPVNPKDTKIFFFYNDSATFPADFGVPASLPITIDQTPGTHTVHIAGSDFDEPVTSAGFVVAGIDPTNFAAAAYHIVPSTVQLKILPGSAVMDQSYTVSVYITNNNPFPLLYTLNWDEFYVTVPDPKKPTPGQGRNIFLGSVDPGDTGPFTVGSFSHHWQWIDATNPITGGGAGGFLNILLNAAAKVGWKDAFKTFLSTDLPLKFQSLIDYLATYRNQVWTDTIDYSVVVKDGTGSPSVTDEQKIDLTVPSAKQNAFAFFMLGNKEASTYAEAGIGALAALQPEIAIPFFAIAAPLYIAAASEYDQAKDPPDSNYQQIASATPFSVPELNAVPPSALKSYAQIALDAEAQNEAEAISYNRAQGAALAGDYVWQSKQLRAAAGFAAQEAADFAELAAMQPTLDAVMSSISGGFGQIASTLQTQGLPGVMTEIFAQAGWTQAEIDSLRQNLMGVDAATLSHPDFTTTGLNLISLAAGDQLFADLQLAVAVQTQQLGQPVSDLTAAESQALANTRAEIAAGLAGNVASPALAAETQGFLQQVIGLALDTNNLAALNDDLIFAYSALPNVTPPLTASPTSPNFVGNEGLVNRFYMDLLGRQAEPAGLAYWKGLLDQGVSRTQVVMGIENGLEYLTNEVQGFYRRFLHRAADPVGLNGWVTFLKQGRTPEQLGTMIVSSPEYFLIRGGGTNAGFVSALYQDALQRDVDPTGRFVNNQALAAGVSRSAIASVIFGSSEYRQGLLQGYYREYLHRDADPTGMLAWVNLLKRRGRDNQVIAGIVASDEYFGQS